MIFKILTFIAAAVPIYLFVRAIFFRPSTRANETLKQVKKQVDLAVTISGAHRLCRRGHGRRAALDVVDVALSLRLDREPCPRRLQERRAVGGGLDVRGQPLAEILERGRLGRCLLHEDLGDRSDVA